VRSRWKGLAENGQLLSLMAHEHQIARSHLGRSGPRGEDERRKRPRARQAGRPRGRQPAPTIAQCLNGGLSWLEVECKRCKTRASLPLDAIRRPRETPIWKLEASLKCRSCRMGRYAPPVHMIKLTETREMPRSIARARTE
jgi:hypothetical protein